MAEEAQRKGVGDAISSIRVYVEGADGLHGRPYMPDHAIDVLMQIAWERQAQTDISGHSRDSDDALGTAALVEKIVDHAEFAIEVDDPDRDDEARRSLIRTAALAMAAVEAIDRRAGNARPDDPIAGAEPIADEEDAARG